MGGDPSRWGLVVAREGGAPHEGWLEFRGERIACELGAAGITRHKQEGDHATPAGALRVRRVLFRADRTRMPAVGGGIAREPIGRGDCWCDDVSHADYNRMVTDPHPGRVERLWREDGLYDLVGVLGHNDAPVERSRGSAIFLHVSRPDGGPTEGCIAVGLRALERLLAQGLEGLVVEPV